MNKQTVIEQTEKYYLPVFGRYPIVADHGKGCYLYDIEGKEYLDFFGWNRGQQPRVCSSDNCQGRQRTGFQDDAHFQFVLFGTAS